MKKSSLFLTCYFLLTLSSLTSAYAVGLELVVKDFSCEKEKFLIHFSVINKHNYDRRNTIVLFKILSEDKPVACKELKLNIPAGADESLVHETIIDVPCAGKKATLKSKMFLRNTRYKIEDWLSDCPR